MILMTEIIKAIAAREHTKPEAVYAEIEKAISIAWESSDPKVKHAQMALTGKYSPPKPEELIDIIARHTKDSY